MRAHGAEHTHADHAILRFAEDALCGFLARLGQFALIVNSAAPSGLAVCYTFCVKGDR